MKSRYLLLAAVALVSIAGCRMSDQPQNDAAPGSAAPASSDWAQFMNNYIEETFRANPTFAAVTGRHEYDGQLPDWSPKGISREVARLRNAIAAAEKFDAKGMSETERFERAYLISQAKG